LDSGDEWDSEYSQKYRSRVQAARHGERDGTAFASIALPYHYSAILSVLNHTKQRLGPSWQVSKVLDWGSATGSGLWYVPLFLQISKASWFHRASLHCFQASSGEKDAHDLKASDSTVETYVGFEKRAGLTSIARRLLEGVHPSIISMDFLTDSLGVNLGNSGNHWRRSFRQLDKVEEEQGGATLALSAFHLSTLPSQASQRDLIQQMWDSNAHVMVTLHFPTPFQNDNGNRLLSTTGPLKVSKRFQEQESSC
jgi:hypothetical protein